MFPLRMGLPLKEMPTIDVNFDGSSVLFRLNSSCNRCIWLFRQKLFPLFKLPLIIVV